MEKYPAGDRLFALIASIPGSGNTDWCDEARVLLNEVRQEHAHELAEKIRKAQHGPEGHTWNWWDAAEIPSECADLIDPKVESGTQQSGCACDGQTLLEVHTEGHCYDTSEVREVGK